MGRKIIFLFDTVDQSRFFEQHGGPEPVKQRYRDVQSLLGKSTLLDAARRPPGPGPARRGVWDWRWPLLKRVEGNKPQRFKCPHIQKPKLSHTCGDSKDCFERVHRWDRWVPPALAKARNPSPSEYRGREGGWATLGMAGKKWRRW